MNKEKRARLEAAGWVVGTAAEFVGLPDDEFSQGDCANCGDAEVLLQKSEQEDEPLHYVCKECFLRGC